MNKATLFTVATVIAAVCFSCSKEKNMPQEEIFGQKESTLQGRPVTLTFNLDPETKMTHVYEQDGGKWYLKSKWVKGDCVKLVHGTTTEYFVLEGDETTASGNFTCLSSTLANDEEYTVSYYKNNRLVASESTDWTGNYASAADWSVQDGTIENLPEVLTGTATYPAPATLTSALTFFHIVGTVPAEADGQTFSHGYLRQTGGTFKLLNKDGASTSSFIKIVPATNYILSTGAILDLYVAAKIDGETNGGAPNGLELRLMNADYDEANTNYFTGTYTGLQSCTIAWTPSTSHSYIKGKVYKKAANFVFNAGQIGLTNNSSPFWTLGDDYTIDPGETLTMVFKNENAGTGEWYKNWFIAFSNEPSRERTSEYYEYFVMRADNLDNFMWAGTNKRHNMAYNKYSCTHVPENISDFMADMNGAEVTITIDYTSCRSLMIVAVSQKGEKKITKKYSQLITGGPIVHAFLGLENSHLTVLDVHKSECAKELDYLQTSTCYVNNTNIPLTTLFKGIPKITAYYKDGTSAQADNSLLTSYNVESAINASDVSTQEFTVTFNGESTSLKVPVVKGIAESGNVNLNGGDIVNPSARKADIQSTKNTQTTKKYYVYSDHTYAWHSPMLYMADVNTTGNQTKFGYARMDAFLDKGGISGSDGTTNWNASTNPYFLDYFNCAKVTVYINNKDSEFSNVHFAIQYDCANPTLGYGYYYTNFGDITTPNSTFYFTVNAYNCYLVEVAADTEGWPGITEI